MQDGHTRKLARADDGRPRFLARHRAILVVVEGPAAGAEFELEQASCTLGRGPGADITIPDDAMSRAHAAFELGRDGFRVRDLGSTNGLRVDGQRVTAADLKHGSRIGLGTHTLQYVVEPRERVGTHDLSSDD